MESVPVKERPKPELVTIGNRQVISSGRWNDPIMADYVLDHGQKKWLDMKELARIAYGNGSPSNQDKVRERLHLLFKHILMKRGTLIVIEYGGSHNKAKVVKIFDPTSPMECQLLQARMDRMRQRRELTAEQYEHALLLWHGEAK